MLCLIKDKQKTRAVSIENSPPVFSQSGQKLFPSVVLLWSNEKSPPNWRWFSIHGGPEEDRTPEPFGCEPNALPTELQAQIQMNYISFFRPCQSFETKILRIIPQSSDCLYVIPTKSLLCALHLCYNYEWEKPNVLRGKILRR